MDFCHRISGVLRAVTPIHIGSGSRTGVIKHSRKFIPGAAIRGAVGTAVIKLVCRRKAPLVRHEECEYFNDCLYVRLFGEEYGKPSKIFFRYAYPLHLTCGGVFRPTPKTLYRCNNPQCQKLFESFLPMDACDLCGSTVKPLRGFRCDKCGEVETKPVSTSRITLTAVERKSLSAAQVGGGAGTLHSLEVISAGARFGFELMVYGANEEELDVLKEIILRALPDEGLGGSKSRGLGKVVVENFNISAIGESDLKGRSSAINPNRFSVEILSPTVLEGDILDPSVLLESIRRVYTMAYHAGKPALPSLELENWAAEGETYTGWSLRWNRRREVRPALSAGSIFEFRSKVGGSELAMGLSALEMYAIGGYKPHGCGQIFVKSA
ncbi:MAG: RAMP superfamily CRISPR-associated protein [Candidatus Methanomethylicaceae archaeon]